MRDDFPYDDGGLDALLTDGVDPDDTVDPALARAIAELRAVYRDGSVPSADVDLTLTLITGQPQSRRAAIHRPPRPARPARPQRRRVAGVGAALLATKLAFGAGVAAAIGVVTVPSAVESLVDRATTAVGLGHGDAQAPERQDTPTGGNDAARSRPAAGHGTSVDHAAPAPGSTASPAASSSIPAAPASHLAAPPTTAGTAGEPPGAAGPPPESSSPGAAAVPPAAVTGQAAGPPSKPGPGPGPAPAPTAPPEASVDGADQGAGAAPETPTETGASRSEGRIGGPDAPPTGPPEGRGRP